MTATQSRNYYVATARDRKVRDLAALIRLQHIPAATVAALDDAGWDALVDVANVYRRQRGDTRMMGAPSDTTRQLVLAALSN